MLKPISFRDIYITRMIITGVTYEEAGTMFEITSKRAGDVAHKSIERLLGQRRKTSDSMSFERWNALSEDEKVEYRYGSQRVLDSMRHYKQRMANRLFENLVRYEEKHYPNERAAVQNVEDVKEAIKLIKEFSN